jgi:inorganic pyrophosphatase
LPKHIFDELIHFLTVYKQLENKPVRIESISGRKEAVATIEECVKLFEDTFEQ